MKIYVFDTSNYEILITLKLNTSQNFNSLDFSWNDDILLYELNNEVKLFKILEKKDLFE
jgi:hypothetical protein